jgi:hypothetical protein
MAQVEITIRRDNGTNITANAEVDDTYVADMAMTLTALLFDSATVEPTPVTPAPATPQQAAVRGKPEDVREPVIPAPNPNGK